jgi:hypothetical protein
MRIFHNQIIQECAKLHMIMHNRCPSVLISVGTNVQIRRVGSGSVLSLLWQPVVSSDIVYFHGLYCAKEKW